VVIKIIHSNERKKHHSISVDDVISFGIHKACILGNIHLFKDIDKNNLHESFPYIQKDEFYSLLKELIQDKLLMEV